MDAARKKLQGARFRYLNEKLYTCSSREAVEYFRVNPKDFDHYHVGFRTQVAAWPVNPVDLIIARLEQEASSKATADESSGNTSEKGSSDLVVADLGCGDAKIKAQLAGKAIVHSFDLVADELRGVIAADMCDVPLPNRSVDAVVFSLSLMNINYVEALVEARRILRPNGLLLVAEVESRLRKNGGAKAFAKQTQLMGFKLRRHQDKRVFLLFEFELINAACTHIPRESVFSACVYKKR